MTRFAWSACASGALFLFICSWGMADPPTSSDAKTPMTVKATFLITGLHCPPCTATVEKSVKSLKGVKSVKVDWNTKNAKVEFDEQQTTSQQIAGRIATTAHMMGGQMKYAGWLALKVPEVAAEGNAEKAKSSLMKVSGVSSVTVYPQQKSVAVEFSSKGEVNSAQLIGALKDAGLEATLLP